MLKSLISTSLRTFHFQFLLLDQLHLLLPQVESPRKRREKHPRNSIQIIMLIRRSRLMSIAALLSIKTMEHQIFNLIKEHSNIILKTKKSHKVTQIMLFGRVSKQSKNKKKLRFPSNLVPLKKIIYRLNNILKNISSLTITSSHILISLKSLQQSKKS